MSARNTLENKRKRKEARESHNPRLHPHPVLDSTEHQTAQAEKAPFLRLLRFRRRAVVKAAGLSNTLRRMQEKGVANLFKQPIRRAYLFQNERALIFHAEIERRNELCKTAPLRSCVPHKKRAKENLFRA